jgi:hypothetical protein
VPFLHSDDTNTSIAGKHAHFASPVQANLHHSRSLRKMSANLEALEWLGRGLDMTNLTPFDISSVSCFTMHCSRGKPHYNDLQVKLLVKPTPIINIQDDTETHTVTIGLLALIYFGILVSSHCCR